MPFVKAQCTNCGGQLEVDSNKEAAICPFCHTPYIVEKAITQYQIQNKYEIQHANITVFGENIETLLADAEALLNQLGNPEQAYEKYEEISKKFPRDYRGWWGMATCQMRNMTKAADIDKIRANVSRAKILFPSASSHFDDVLSDYQVKLNNCISLQKDNERLWNNVLLSESKHRTPIVFFVISALLFVVTLVLFIKQSQIFSLLTIPPAIIFLAIALAQQIDVSVMKRSKAKIAANDAKIASILNSFTKWLNQVNIKIKSLDSY